jgi:hypothetical protein
MPGGSALSYGNIKMSEIINVTLSPGIVIPSTTSEQTFTVPGLLIADQVTVSKPTIQAGIGIINARVSSANTLAIGFMNLSTVTITPTASELYTIEVNRPDWVTGQALPYAIV